MTKEELQKRIESKELEISKIEKRITKWSTGMRPEAIRVCEPLKNAPYGTPEYQKARDAWEQYKKQNIDGIWAGDSKLKDLFNPDDWNKGPNFNELYTACRDFAEANVTLNKYKTQLDKISNFENEEKIEVIWGFLQAIRKQNYEYFEENALLYKDLKSKYEEEFKKYTQTEEYKSELERLTSLNPKHTYTIKYKLEQNFKEKYYNKIHPYTISLFTNYKGDLKEDILNKYLDKDIQSKYTHLVHQVTEKAGVIQDASNLYIDGQGNIAGTIKGDKHTVQLWTTLSGGYNIQILHYRSYVSIVK